ncbi:hypothetical protein DH2020_037733 [Rehmannia glutinosa]|uniref:IST1-like protein n=1 Tax=Rehmannia glutinosa TaxID=99300 RepID=A0ABR0V197_REHGL
MGKKLNALFGRSSKTAKLKMLANLAISRIAILKNLHSVKCSQAKSDVVQLLRLGHQERAIIRVEHVIKEENTLDAFVRLKTLLSLGRTNVCISLSNNANSSPQKMTSYCSFHSYYIFNLGFSVVDHPMECPDELKEAISSLIFAASRCGEFPELQQIRVLLTSKFGTHFATSAVELRNNCGVYPKMIQRFSTRQASLESRQKLLKQIAKDNGITLQLDHEALDISNKEKCEHEHRHMHESNESATVVAQNKIKDAAKSNETLSESVKARKAYRDVADAAEDAFESAAYAAAAARAAVKLSRLESWDDDDSDDRRGSHHRDTRYDSSPISETDQTGRNERHQRK